MLLMHVKMLSNVYLICSHARITSYTNTVLAINFNKITIFLTFLQYIIYIFKWNTIYMYFLMARILAILSTTNQIEGLR